MKNKPGRFTLIFPAGDTEEYKNPSKAADAVCKVEADVNIRNRGMIVSALASLAPGEEVEFPSGLRVLASEDPNEEPDNGESEELSENDKDIEENGKSRRNNDGAENADVAAGNAEDDAEEIEPELPIEPGKGSNGRTL